MSVEIQVKTCFGCQFMDMENGYMVSELTGWCSGYWRCLKQKFYECAENADKPDMQKIISKMIKLANECEYYKEVTNVV